VNDQTPHRPTSLAEMDERQALVFNFEDIAASMASYRPQSTDLIISPFGKCGTTWLQQTFHTLRTKGDMEFDDISRVVPWIETSRALGLDLGAPQKASPRGFKSHLSYDLVPKGARYVVSLRDPKDALVSWYRFMEGWWFEPGTVTLDATVKRAIAQRGKGRDYWHHLTSWWEQRENPDVLLLSYEHMSAEPEAHIRRLAHFAGIALDDALLALTLERTSLSFMLAHKDRFDDKLMRDLSERVGGLPSGSDSSKVRQGKVGGYREEMTPELAAAIDDAWRETVTPKTGFASYAELEAALRSAAD
jgi:hypothetical protein